MYNLSIENDTQDCDHKHEFDVENQAAAHDEGKNV